MGVHFSSAARADIDFSRDIRPILADRCFKCHGFDDKTREADLGLHNFSAATRDLGGYRAIAPGDATTSEIIERMLSDDPDEVMPPSKANKPKLTAEEVALFRQWINEGAKYEQHWAFVPPREALAGRDLPDSIDGFVKKRLADNDLSASPQADAHTLVRRVYLDLIGLPPTPEEADAFVKSTDPDAYAKLVDRLLESPRYGERWARQWLDLARYADTNGYEKDRARSIWPYRDWVIKALNADMPYDRFSVEQLAGDMLPNASPEQLIATGFHRNTMLNEEGGIDPLEYRFYAMVDRVATTGTVWMGLTTGCAQCHTHKFDPITHTDYYAVMALLNNADEPAISVSDAEVEKRQEAMEAQIAAAKAELVKQIDEKKYAAWLEAEKAKAVNWTSLEPTAMKSTLPYLEHEGEGVIFASGDFGKRDVYDLEFELPKDAGAITALRLEALPDERLPANGPGAAYYEGRSGDFFLSELNAHVDGAALKFSAGSADFGKIAIGSGGAEASNVFDGKGSTGWSTATREGEPHELVLNVEGAAPAGGKLKVKLLFERHFVAGLGKFRISVTDSAKVAGARSSMEIVPLLASDDEMRRAYALTSRDMAEARKPLDDLNKKRPDLSTTMVMRERPKGNPRKTQRHHRGEYLKAEELVAPAVPTIFPPLPEGAAPNRLNFARWLVDAERNPLVARVTVNRAWRAFFGQGLLHTSGDFGLQSGQPSHPDLLSWLAVKFVDEDGWSLKRLHRRIVSSETYRQSSKISPELRAKDPENVLLARGPRFRLEGGMIRDAALEVAGLLSEKMHGPSVFPPQSPSVTGLAYGGMKWNPSPGEDRYRRSLYTFSKRTAPFAAYLTFDGPTGEACIPRRERSNTPLQALTLLNDEMFTEAASAVVNEALGRDESDTRKIASYLFRRVMTRPPTDEEIADLSAFYDHQMQRLKAGELTAEELADQSKGGEHAAWVMVARVLLNLDEFVTKG